jgi:gentisate 1,2-dioxygenase
MGAQMILPGEFAPAHRHMMEAIRFVVKGRGAATIVEGEEFSMEEGDLITTPNWTWHDHINADKEPIIWLDGANGPMIQYYQVGFSEPYSQKQQPVTRPPGSSEGEYGVTRPPRPNTGPNFRPPYRYRWDDTERRLRSLGEGAGDPFDGAILRYTNPVTGASTLPTMSCEIQLLRPGEKGRSHRHTHTAIYHGFRGRGSAMIGGARFEWEKGDSFVVPPWTWHAHENPGREPAVIFSINDRPAIEALGFFREEAAE